MTTVEEACPQVIKMDQVAATQVSAVISQTNKVTGKANLVESQVQIISRTCKVASREVVHTRIFTAIQTRGAQV